MPCSSPGSLSSSSFDSLASTRDIAAEARANPSTTRSGPAKSFSAAFIVAKRDDVIAGELGAVEDLTERPRARLIDIAVHRRLDLIPRAIIPYPCAPAPPVRHLA